MSYLKHLKIFIFIMLIFLNIDVFALEVNVTNSITSPSSSTQGRYSGTEIYNTGTTNVYNVNTRYNGRLSRIRYNLPLPDSLGQCFTTNLEYTITMNMATDDWRNKFGSVNVSAYGNDYHIGSVTYVSYKKIYFKFKIPSSVTNCIDYVLVDLKSTNISSTAFTGVSNWNLSKITLTDPSISSSNGAGGGSSSTPTPTPIIDYSDITNNANQNTQNIIDNQNNNTQDIIDNNNSNTQDIVDTVHDSIEQAGQVVQNGLSTINSQLGTCFNNLINFYDVTPHINTYLSNNNAYQIDSDNYTTSRSLKLQLYSLDGTLIDAGESYRPELSIGRFNFPFTYTDNVSYLVFGINGATTDTTLRLDLQTLDLFPNETYTLSFSVSNATNGDVTFTNFSLIKGNYVSRVVIPYKQGICTSKIDDFISQSQTNTTDIIDNQNNNTQDIIDNQNDNTDSQIDSQRVCSKINYTVGNDYNSLNSSNGGITSNNYYFVTTYIPINSSDKLNKLERYTGSAGNCFYNYNKTLISCFSNNDYPEGDIPIPNNTEYVRFTINRNDNRPQYEICKNGNQAVSDSINNLNDTMNNSNIDDKTGFFTNFSDNSHGLTSIITLPLTTIQSLANSSCVSLSVPIPFTDSNVSLPCMSVIYSTYIPSVFSIWQVVSFGIISYFICLDIFKMVKGFKDPNEDKVEVLDL